MSSDSHDVDKICESHKSKYITEFKHFVSLFCVFDSSHIIIWNVVFILASTFTIIVALILIYQAYKKHSYMITHNEYLSNQ